MMPLLAVEIASVLLITAGVALVNLPAALILGGLTGIFACERASSSGNRPRKAARSTLLVGPSTFDREAGDFV